MIGRKVRFGSEYRWIELDEEEVEEAIEETIKINKKIWKKIQEEKMPDAFIPKREFFEKIGVSSYTVMKHKLEKKISDKLDEYYE